MSASNWSEKLIPEDLSEDLKIISDSIGFENVRSLINGAAGLSFYVPKAPPRSLVEREIKANFTGENFVGRRLSVKLGISEKLFFRIVAEMEAEGFNFRQ